MQNPMPKRYLSSERAHKQVLTIKKNMHLILYSSTGTLVTVAISTAPDGGWRWNIRGLHRKGLAEREKKERVLSSERAHKQVLTMKQNMHLIMRYFF